MSEILSDDEIQCMATGLGDYDKVNDCYVFNRTGDWSVVSFTRAVERAVVEKLAAMGGEEMPKPTVRWTVKSDVIDYYTANQMRELFARGVAAGMAQERARCVAVCDGLAEIGQVLPRGSYSKGWRDALLKAEQAISKPENDEEELM